MATIRLTEIQKSFGSTEVLKGIDLSIEAGEFLTLVGPSGCGKSTLLRIIAGLEAQSAGEVRIGERLVNGVRAAERNLAMVFQSYALYPHLTVAENMLVPLRLRDLAFRERLPLLGPLLARAKYADLRRQVTETAEVLRLDTLLDRKPGQLSGGQRQRAALGRAMVRKPTAFLMDEPLSNLDAALRVHMRAELAELHRSLGTTFIYVTHDQAEALTMSDRMAVMMGGEILQLDRPQIVYDDPADLRVAEFVGSPKINALPGAADAEGRVHCLGIALTRRLAAEPGQPPREVTAGLRPEHFALSPQAGSDTLSGSLIYRENLGADVYLHLDLGTLRLVVRAGVEEARDYSLGARVHAVPRHDKALVFAEDGRRLRFRDETAGQDADTGLAAVARAAKAFVRPANTAQNAPQREAAAGS
ncbi:ABC transporter ATP-binding protein [Pelagibius sp.]|uniref:ABC transporter ATP-binding protein n=1 Tax=Pelagibius sp. TaxID=1931238 RepID=UPI002604826E|nr:ABC transporter ATP-binding protein [Pelagibius sp.]